MSALWFFVTLRAVLTAVPMSDAKITWAFGTLGVFSVLYAMTLVLSARSDYWVYAWAIAACTAMIPNFSVLQGVCVVLILGVGLLVRNRVRHITEDDRDAHFFQPLRVAYSLWFTVMALTIAVSFYNTRPTVSATLNVALKREHVVTVMQRIEPLLKSGSPDFSIEQTAEDYILSQIDTEVPAYLRAELVHQQLSAINTKYSTNIQPDDTMADVSYEIVIAFSQKPFGKFGSFADMYSRYFPLISAAGIFFFLQFMFFFLKWGALLVALVLLRIMDRLGVIAYKERTQTVKYPTLS